MYPSLDGTMVPMTIVRNKDVLPSLDFKPDKPIPTLIDVYGGFFVVEELASTSDLYIWLKHLKGLFVVAHVRGGGELGIEWSYHGKRENKTNSLNDLIAAA